MHRYHHGDDNGAGSSEMRFEVDVHPVLWHAPSIEQWDLIPSIVEGQGSTLIKFSGGPSNLLMSAVSGTTAHVCCSTICYYIWTSFEAFPFLEMPLNECDVHP